MVYVRWIKKKNGTMVGPYLYRSVRKGNKVVGEFIGKASLSDIKKCKKE